MREKKKYAVFTMDVETFADTECISASGLKVDVDLMDGLDEYIELLNRYDIKCTLFTVGDLAPRIAERLRSHIESGHALALHNYAHVTPMSVSPERFREELSRAKERMETLFGVTIDGFRAPCFSLDKQRLKVLQELGFRYDSSYLDYMPARHSIKLDLQDFQKIGRGIFRDKGFYEFGLAKEKVFGWPFPISGGGYVRMSNWGFIKTLIQQYIRRNDYYVFYLHPFELTRKRIPILKELKRYDQYYFKKGIGKSYTRRVEKIIRMLKKNDYEFVTFEQLAQIMDKK